MTRARDLVRQHWPDEVVVATQALTGGVSARVTAVTLRRVDGTDWRVVVREYGPRDLATKPDVAAQEFALLTFLHGQGLPVPQPLAHTPGMLIQTFLDGRSGAEVEVDPEQLARFLVRLHGLVPGTLALLILPDVSPQTGPPDDSLSESRIRAALASHPPLPGRTAVLHGDLWPGNTLWHSRALSAVLDWEDAALGDPLADVGNTRLELLFFQGEAAMQTFTAGYATRTGLDLTDLPAWDLRAALRPCGRLHTWGLEPAQERTMRERHAAFVTEAVARLALT
ncbi:phosphotransferase [uncultured Deinococcus sp.]|uniref:phosphotransferase family protein n=1 Tax=uncultured Deinococcus sp. TaxID=158789 RepID=UPI0025CE1EEA|nr:phosphotransferase [uncultured Deinococcus sp.]